MFNYDPGTPQAPDIPANNQDEFLNNFQSLNTYFGVDHIPFGNVVTFATNANPCVCTSPLHGLVNGDVLTISHFSSLVDDIIQLWDINGGPYIVTVIDPNTFSINANASANPTYLADSGSFFAASFPYGQHKKITFPQVQLQGPNTSPPLGSPYSAVYSKEIEKLANLFFQNGVGANFEKLFMNLPIVEFVESVTPILTNSGKGFKTPWGITINTGFAVSRALSPITYNLAIPFTSNFFAIIATVENFNSPTNGSLNAQLLASGVGLNQFSIAMKSISPLSQIIANFNYMAIGV